jgi:hypothetical protein
MTGILGIELRRSLLVRLSPLAAMGMAALMINDIHTWRGIWPEASANISTPLLFIGPLMGGVGAWEVRRRYLAGSARSARAESAPWTRPLLAAHLLAGVAVIAAGALCAIIVNLTSGAPDGFLWPSYLAVALACLSECIAVGFLSIGAPRRPCLVRPRRHRHAPVPQTRHHPGGLRRRTEKLLHAALPQRGSIGDPVSDRGDHRRS